MQKISLFKGRKLVIATMHKKEQVVAPLLHNYLDVEIIVPHNFNSDQFGTFTRDIKRSGTQLEAAYTKLNAAMSIAGVDLGVASEGSFGAHPSLPFIQANYELLLFLDKRNGYEIKGHYITPETNICGQYVSTVREALDLAKKIGFPSHGVIIRRSKNCRFGIYKDIKTEDLLVKTVTKMLSGIFCKQVFVESDMRAHRNPTRMKAIKRATENLLQNIASLCPRCQSPGFILFDTEKGLPCSLCNMPTNIPINNIYKCTICSFQETKHITKYGLSAKAQYCSYCNP